MRSQLKRKVYQLDITNHLSCFVLGSNPEEWSEKRRVIVNISLRFQLPNIACSTDKLSDTVCYAGLLRFLDLKLENARFDLIEKATQFVYEVVEEYISENVAVLYPGKILKKIEVIKTDPFCRKNCDFLESASFLISDW